MRSGPGTWPLPLILALLLAALLLGLRANVNGDVVEYSLDTIALAAHGTPDIRLSDIERGKALLPALAEPYGELERGMKANAQAVYPAFARGREGKVYSIHFFGYSLLAAVPFKVLEALHLPPVKAFQIVNLAAIFVLGLALGRFFRSAWKALAGLGLFMLCGGALYSTWTSPECVSAAGLLAGMLLFASGAPVAGALLAGLAGQQNPTILFFFAFAPLLLLLQNHRRGDSLAATLKAVLCKRNLAALAAGMAVFALPPLFSLYQYGVPNIIVKHFSDSQLIGLVRLQSFFFDLNQGMILGIPAVLAVLLLWGWRDSRDAPRRALLLGACTLFTLALAVPALAVTNWNSGAAGIMRYAFWAAMPFLFALLLCLRERARWPLPLLLGLSAVQLAAMVHASRYEYVEFSPLARAVLAIAPDLYHPEPEIFAERMARNDDYIWPDKIYVYRVGDRVVKTLVNATNLHADAQLCGNGAMLSPGNRYTDTARGWRYIDGQVRCVASSGQQLSFGVEQFSSGEGIKLAAGWSGIERNGGNWNGAWSLGVRSRVTITAADGLRPTALTVVGHYLDGNKRTRLMVNGEDLGWHRFDQEGPISLPAAAAGAPVLEIELEHESPHVPGPGDERPLAFFLHQVSVRGAGKQG